MLKGFGEFFGAVIAPLVPWVFAAGLCWLAYTYGLPRGEAFLKQAQDDHANVARLQAIVDADKTALAAAKASCKVSAARSANTSALLSKLAAGGAPAGGLVQSDIEELLK